MWKDLELDLFDLRRAGSIPTLALLALFSLAVMKANSKPHTWGAEQCLTGLVLAPPAASVVSSRLNLLSPFLCPFLLKQGWLLWPWAWQGSGQAGVSPPGSLGSSALFICQPGAGQWLPWLGMSDHGRGMPLLTERAYHWPLHGIRQWGLVSLASVHPNWSCFSEVKDSALCSFSWVLLSLWSWV